ncbi:MAG: hypothetical protein K8S56_10185, partial [Candidatus Cloacimonetes bacterium]|nr:hypothetical protein [Candidatus Cloacimonadota bacterium]
MLTPEIIRNKLTRAKSKLQDEHILGYTISTRILRIRRTLFKYLSSGIAHKVSDKVSLKSISADWQVLPEQTEKPLSIDADAIIRKADRVLDGWHSLLGSGPVKLNPV